MTIAKRFMLLLAVPLIALLSLGVFTRLELFKVEDRSRFVAESRIVALATWGNLSRNLAEMRVSVRASSSPCLVTLRARRLRYTMEQIAATMPQA